MGRRKVKKQLAAAFFACCIASFAFAQEPPAAAPAPSEQTAAEPAPVESARLALDAAETSAERHRREITEEASAQLFHMDLWGSDVSLYINGYWKGSLSVNWGIANSPLGTAPESDDSPLLFTQEADLTLSLWLWQKWFLEVSFLDDYDVNTYRAGYQGFPGETVQYVGIGNTGLDFPVFPYLDLGGDSPSSLGVYGRFGSDTLTFHTLVRYDAAAREERTFVGNRERSFSTLSPDKPIRGKSFVLSDENIPSTPVVYFEDKNGGLSGGGRRWRLANPSEYAVSARYGVVELVREAPGMVAVSYPGIYPGGTPNLGTYNDGTGATLNPTFLGAVQYHFDPSTVPTIDLRTYPQPGGGPGGPAVIPIAGVQSLVIYEPGTFSPFERQSRYAAPSNNTEDAALIRLSNGERVSGYEIFPVTDLTLPVDISLYSITGDDTSREVFEIVTAGAGGRDRRDPETLWPLGGDYPELYLPGTQRFTEDIRIRFTNYGAAGAYTIGTDVIPGSVQVWRGGILDSQVSYDSGGGTVTLASPVGFNEVIRITYLKRSEERRLGSLAAGVGAVYTPEDSPFSAEAALGMRWNVSKEAYTEEGASSPGTVGFGAKTSWDYDRLKTSLSLGLGFEQPDTTGLYRVAGMEGNSEIVMGVSTASGFISERPAQVAPVFPSPSVPPVPTIPSVTFSNRISLTYRNYRETNFLGSSELKPIEWNGPVVSGLSGPYPVKDLDSDVFVAEFESLGAGQWTGFQAPLGRDGELLEQAKAIVVPIRFYGFDTSNPKILVVAQFGSLAEEGSGGVENSALLVEAPLFYDTSLPSSWLGIENDYSDGRNIAITLTEDMRRRLQNATQMRILIINTDTGAGSFSGRVLVAKPIVMGASWRAITVDASGKIKAAPDTVSIAEMRSNLHTKKVDRLHESGINNVLHVEWNGVDSAGADGRTASVPLSNYRTASFYIKGALPATSDFHFMISRGPDSYRDPDRTALEVTMPNPFTDGNHWYEVQIDYGSETQRIKIDGTEYPGTIHYRPSALRQSGSGDDFFAVSGQSGYAAVFFTDPGGASSGTFEIDEICLEDPSPSYRINGGATLGWRHPEALVSIGDRTVLSGAAFNTALESAARGDPFNSRAETFTGIQSRSRGEISLLDTRLSGNLSFMTSNDSSYWSAGHGVSRSFGPLSISETFNTAPYDETMNHSLSLGLQTFLFGNFSSAMTYQNKRLSRNWNASTGINAEQNRHPGFILEGNLGYTEKTDDVLAWMPNYGQTWAQSWTAMVPDSGEDSPTSAVQNRNARGRAGFSLDLLPAGLELSFEGNSAVSAPMDITQSASTARIDVPFTFGSVRGNLRSQRDISRSMVYAGDNIGDDISQYGSSLYDTAPLWREAPVFSLFDSNLDSVMDNTLSNYTMDSENTRFRELIALNLLFPERYDALSLIVPVSFLTQLDRNMEQRLDTRLDVFTISSGLGFSSINMFGAMGVYPVFKFYQNDELRHSLTGIISVPRNEDPLWRIQAEQNIGVYGFHGAELALNNTLTVAYSGWIESFGVVWTIPREKTLLSAIYGAGMGKLSDAKYFPALSELANTEYEKLIRESLEFIIDHSGDSGVYSAALGHESLVRILGTLTLTGFAKLTVHRDTRADLLSFMLNFGTTLTVSF
ncbi:MAG: hypothetical protein LBK74_03660 [Treponema sp.]|jgi:hypothetical protein|nr:hypothetical protein [Treponema sp.]